MEDDKIQQLEKGLDELKKNSKSKDNWLTLPSAIVIAAAIVSFSILVSKGGGFGFGSLNNPNSNSKSSVGEPLGGRVQVSADNDPFIGPENAKVTLIEFSDFQCPFCRRFWQDTLTEIKKEYIDAGKSVKFVYRDFPLSFHEMAQKYGEASECAKDQGKFWEMHDKIFQEQEKLGSGTITAYDLNDVKRWARELGFLSSRFNQCLDSDKYREEVQNDFADGSKAGVNGTPTVFINGRPVVGAQSYPNFKAIIDDELGK